MFQAFEEEWSLAASWPPAFRGESHSLVSCRQTSLLRSAQAVKMTEIGVPSLFYVRTYVAEFPEYLPIWALCPTHRPTTTFQFLPVSDNVDTLSFDSEMSQREEWDGESTSIYLYTVQVGDVHTKFGTGTTTTTT
jgi:hypothetical protein